MKKRNKIISIVLLSLLVVGITTASLLQYFGQIEQTIGVGQGLFVDGNDWNVPIDVPLVTTTSLESPTFVSVHYLDNQANVEATVNLVDSCSATTDGCNDITTNYYETNLRSGNLILSRKDIGWKEIIEDTDVVITYSTNVETGETKIDNIVGLDIDYTLIYYADEEFDNDGVRLATPGQAYAIDIGVIIPISSRDGNLKSGADYCDYDSYDHCRGIKLWAIRTIDLSENTIIWNSGWQSAYYFETDILGWNHNNPLNLATVLAGTQLDFVIVNDVPVGMIPAIYTITTTVDIVPTI